MKKPQAKIDFRGVAMFINIIDKEGNEETLFNIYTTAFRNHVFSKQDELNKIGVMVVESYTDKGVNHIPEKLYRKVLSIINKDFS